MQRTPKLVLKDKDSFLILTDSDEIKIIEKGVEVFSQVNSGYSNPFFFYSKTLRCYFKIAKQMIFRKRIDRSQFYRYMPLHSSFDWNCQGRYSHVLESLIIKNREDRISFIDIVHKKVAITLKSITSRPIIDFSLIGQKAEKLLILTSDTRLLLIGLHSSQGSRSLLIERQITSSGVDSSLIYLNSIKAYDQGKHLLFLKIHDRAQNLGDKIFCIYVEKDYIEVFTTSAKANFCLNGVKQFKSFSCLKQIGTHLILIGMVSTLFGSACLFDFDLMTDELKEIRGKEVNNSCYQPVIFQHLDDCFYCVGSNNKVVRFRLTD